MIKQVKRYIRIPKIPVEVQFLGQLSVTFWKEQWQKVPSGWWKNDVGSVSALLGTESILTGPIGTASPALMGNRWKHLGIRTNNPTGDA